MGVDRNDESGWLIGSQMDGAMAGPTNRSASSARFESGQLVERPDESGGDQQAARQGGHETGRHVGQLELPGQVRLLDGWGACWTQTCRVGR